jgi:altronate hydrolase
MADGAGYLSGMPASPPAVVHLSPSDHVAVALRDLAEGQTIPGPDGSVTARAPIPSGHKIAVTPVEQGEAVLKYGWPIGRAVAAITPGEHVHTHNLKTLLGAQGLAAPDVSASADQTRASARTFEGYLRPNGRVGTRNEIWVLCTVGCVARTAQRIAEEATRRLAGRIDGVYAFTHPFGCSQLGDDLDNTRAILAGLAGHPNAGGVVIVGLGCENNRLQDVLAAAHVSPDRIRSFSAQEAQDEVEEGVAAVMALAEVVETDRRTTRPLSDLVLGLKCGGSDGFSGLTANPLVGRASSVVAGSGGVSILTEIPEIFGAEHLLMARASTPEVRDAVADLVKGFKRYFTDHGQPVSENPSPGNLAGGITTLEEKSLGAVQKAGAATLTQVLRYGEQAMKPGLALLEAPGNDAVSSTALTAAGATVILFTTGRGTPLGFPAPTLKIASNSRLAQAKPRWIDFDAGALIAGQTQDEATEALMDLVVETASGRPTRAELNGEREIAIWKTGVTL